MAQSLKDTLVEFFFPGLSVFCPEVGGDYSKYFCIKFSLNKWQYVTHLHSNSTLEFLHEVETVRSQESTVQNFPSSTGGDGRDVVHQSGQILHSKVVSVIFLLVTQSLQYFAEIRTQSHNHIHISYSRAFLLYLISTSTKFKVLMILMMGLKAKSFVLTLICL